MWKAITSKGYINYMYHIPCLRHLLLYTGGSPQDCRFFSLPGVSAGQVSALSSGGSDSPAGSIPPSLVVYHNGFLIVCSVEFVNIQCLHLDCPVFSHSMMTWSWIYPSRFASLGWPSLFFHPPSGSCRGPAWYGAESESLCPILEQLGCSVCGFTDV